MSKIVEAMRETAQDLYDAGVMSKFTLRQIEKLCLSPPEKSDARGAQGAETGVQEEST